MNPGRPTRYCVSAKAVDALERDDALSLPDDQFDEWLRKHMPAQSRVLLTELRRRGFLKTPN